MPETNCAKLSKSDTLLIVSEDPKYGWYNKDITNLIYNQAKKCGIKTDIMIVGEPTNDPDNNLKIEIDKYDCALFFARIGDQDRFETYTSSTKRIMSYVRNTESFFSLFGSTNYNAMEELKKVIDNLILNANMVEIRCPLGTKIVGKITESQSKINNSDVSVIRFPIVIHSPILANNFSGKVVLSKYLTPTGSKVYKPNYLKLDEPVNVILKNGKIINFLGDTKQVRNVIKHYKNISKMFSIDEKAVHSWHSGIHPGINYRHKISNNPDMWSNTMFVSSKYLHFHTCGNYAPGEICWMVANSTIKIDGKEIFEKGVLKVHSFKETIDCLNKWDDLKNLYATNKVNIKLET